MTYDFALAGNMILDTVKYIDRLPEKLELVAIRGMEQQPGGLVPNVGRVLARLMPRSRIAAIGRVGEDGAADVLLKMLSEYPALDLSMVKKSGVTSFMDVMTISATGERTFFTYKGADGQLTPEDVPYEALRGAILHMGYALLMEQMDAPDPEYGTRLARALATAQAHGVVTSVDCVSESGGRYESIVVPAIRYADIATFNETEAAGITGVALRDGRLLTERLPEALRILRGMGARKWAVIHAPEGAAGLDPEGNYVFVPSLRLPKGFIKSSVGAGDAFAAGLLAGAKRDLPLPDALALGNGTAAAHMSEGGVKSYEDTLRIMEQYR